MIIPKTTIGFCLFRYFPFGGLQRDFVRIAKLCQAQGFGVRVYTMQWQGEVPEGFDVRIVRGFGLTNHAKALNFSTKMKKILQTDPPSLLVGFNKMGSLDVYFAADTCFAKGLEGRSALYRALPRAKTFLKLEREVFAEDSKTFAMLIAQKQIKDFTEYYQIAPSRYRLLPCGASEKYFLPQEDAITQKIRADYRIDDEGFLILHVGSAHNRKGVDRAINAVANLPEQKRSKSVFVIIGDDDSAKMKLIAKAAKIAERVIFDGPKYDVERYIKAADLLLHPARVENTGTTIVEALAADLPVLCSAACGYAQIVLDCKAGMVCDEPFEQENLNVLLAKILDKSLLAQFRSNARLFGTREKLTGLDSAAAKIIMDFANKKTSTSDKGFEP